MKYYEEVGVADGLVVFRSSPRRPLGRYSGLKYRICANITTIFCSTCRQTTAVVNRADRRRTTGVVSCCKQSATLGTCCSQSLSSVSSWCYINIKFFCLHFSLYLLVSWAWWDCPLTWLTNHHPSVLYDAAGWVMWPVKSSPKLPIMCWVGR